MSLFFFINLKVYYISLKYYYKKIFTEHFGENYGVIGNYWLPKWCNTVEPSARTLTV